MSPWTSLTSYPSNPDKHGIRYWLSIDPLSSRSPPNSNVQKYKALAISDLAFSDKDRTVMSVTFLKGNCNSEESRAFAEGVLRLNAVVQRGTLKFNTKMTYQSAMRNETVPLIEFQGVLMAELESTSTLYQRKEGEYFVFSDNLLGCKTFLSSRQDRSCSPRLLNAFVHHFFCFTGGRMAVDDLRGIYSNDGGYTLEMPTVHSLTEDCGYGDGGKDGIRRVIQNHECNDYCSHLIDMEVMLSRFTSTQRAGV